MFWGYILLNICLLGVLFWARVTLIRFLKTHTAIDSPAALAAFKTMARWNMYGALAFLACGAATWIWGFFLIMKYGLSGFVTALVFSVLLLVLSLFLKKVEERSRNLRCLPELQEDYKRVSQTWLKKVFPDF